MAIDEIKLTGLLQEAILRKLGDEVDLIFLFGSNLSGASHHYSDLDISFVPSKEETWENITVVVEEVMVDFFPISWSWLERMANFDDVRCTILLNNRLTYQRSQAVADRFRELASRLNALMQPDARPKMLKKAQSLFQETGYQYYLLRQHHAEGRLLPCVQDASNILKTITHSLAVLNQAAIDTRKLPQVLGLPKLPAGFAQSLDRVTRAFKPDEILAACETLLKTTRDLILEEQKQVQRTKTSFPAVFKASYPELYGDLRHIMLACERRDWYNLNLVPFLHEFMIHTAQALTGVKYSGFNSISEYEQELAALGFPDLLKFAATGDFDGLHAQCKAFDLRMREFLTERSVALNVFASVDDLEKHLKKGGC